MIHLAGVVVCAAALAACGSSASTAPEREAGASAARTVGVAGNPIEPADRAGGGHAEAGAVESGFVPPSAARRIRAIGSTAMLPAALRRAFVPTSEFDLLVPPQPGEWLAEHYERGQTFDEFVGYRSNRPDDQRGTIYLLPMSVDGGELSLSARSLADFARAYFGMRIDVLPTERLDPGALRTRQSEGAAQYLTADVLRHLEARLPADAYAIVALTDADLYASPDWNHVFGQASLRGRVGVVSLARLHPGFYGVQMDGDAASAILTRRAVTVLAHELGHVFGLKHCVFYRCVMGGAHDLRELDGAPLHACPVCLRKLQKLSKFDPGERYRRLARLLRRLGLESESDWAAARWRFVVGDDE